MLANYSINVLTSGRNQSIMNQHVREQLRSARHRIAVLYFAVIIFFSYFKPTYGLVGLLIFFLITSFQFLKSMLVYLIILTGAMIVFAPLAPIILVMVIVLFLLRIHYVYEHWRAMLAGLILYGVTGLFLYQVTDSAYLLLPLFFDFIVRIDSYMGSASLFDYSWTLILLELIEPLFFSIIGFFLLRQLLIWLYRHEYTSYSALGLMGSVPLVILSFVLPFLKLQIDMFAFEGKTAAPVSETKTAPVKKSIEFVDPHYVKGHYRADGTYVEGYWRDGDGNTSVDLSKEEGGGYIRRRG